MRGSIRFEWTCVTGSGSKAAWHGAVTTAIVALRANALKHLEAALALPMNPAAFRGGARFTQI